MEIKRTFVGPGSAFVDAGRIAIIASDRRTATVQRRERGEGNRLAGALRRSNSDTSSASYRHATGVAYGRRVGDKEAHQERRVAKGSFNLNLRRRKGDERRSAFGKNKCYLHSPDVRIRQLERRHDYGSITFKQASAVLAKCERRSGKDRRADRVGAMNRRAALRAIDRRFGGAADRRKS